jgi:hypothetical protein
MSATQVAELTCKGGSQYDAAFAADLGQIYAQKLFGFRDYVTYDDATKMKFIGGHGSRFNGPIKS